MTGERTPDSRLVIYQPEDGGTRVQCRFAGESIWLTRSQLADLFQTTPQSITLHLKALFAESDLHARATCKGRLQVRGEVSRGLPRRVRRVAWGPTVRSFRMVRAGQARWARSGRGARATIRDFRMVRVAGLARFAGRS